MIKTLILSFLAIFSSIALAEEAAPEVAAGPMRHIVMVKFKETTTPEQLTQIEKEFAALETRIDTITDFEWGLATTAEQGMDQGFTHCFVVTFADRAGLEVYLPHEAHQAFVELFKPQIDKILVLDFIAK